ncbi:PREDICTED: uncharacterized protein LOC104804423 isoform X2 [Tarenaya hassleriana]|uniref:uncharacterized protein LOC104804423 isoform X2 n=1 Tax=Tarenaya hassleriana TaxID=28532 RepID=UPI00053CA5E0|nr:PREDICTED: uncharacterized protein LOC104804423 isoform X2 [Tarenaya hassleriana]
MVSCLGFSSSVASRRKNETPDACDRKNPDCNDGFVKKPRIVREFDRKSMISRRKIDAADWLGKKEQNLSNRLCSECALHDGFGRKRNATGEARNGGIATLPDTEIAENGDAEGGKENEEGVPSDEDQIFDVITLRKMVKRERKRGESLDAELEKERVAASSAAEESMAMLLRLQSEKSMVEMEAEQYKRIAKQKQDYDQEMVRELKWLVMEHEEERGVLEDKLRLCVEKLKTYSDGDGETDMDGFLESLVGQRSDMGSPEMDSKELCDVNIVECSEKQEFSFSIRKLEL